MMSGTFPTALSQAAISQGYFPKRQLLKSVLTAALDPLAHSRQSARPN